MQAEAYQPNYEKKNVVYELDLVVVMAELSFYFPVNRDYIKEVHEFSARVTEACLQEFSLRRPVDLNYIGRRIAEFHQDLGIAIEARDKAAMERLKEARNDLELLASQPIKNDRNKQMLQRKTRH